MLKMGMQFPQFKTEFTSLTVKDSLRLFFDISVVSFSMFVFNDPVNFCSICHERTSKRDRLGVMSV